VTSRQAEVLQLIGEGDHASADLAETLGISRQAVRKHLSALEAAGLVEPSTANRRSKKIRWHLASAN
jgi:predicted ArsR family transcriptional regulator